MKTNANKVTDTVANWELHIAVTRSDNETLEEKWAEGVANDNKGIFQYCSALRIRAVGQNK